MYKGLLMGKAGFWRAASLVVFGLLFISFTATVFADEINIVSSLSTRLILHIIVIVSVIAYLLFTERIYRTAEGSSEKRVFIFAVVFAAPALLIRGVEVCVLYVPLGQMQLIYDLIVKLSEFVLWTVALPFSLLILLHVFANWMEKPLNILCGVAAFCCLMTLVCRFAYPEPIIIWSLIGIWGATLVGTVFVYIVKALSRRL